MCVSQTILVLASVAVFGRISLSTAQVSPHDAQSGTHVTADTDVTPDPGVALRGVMSDGARVAVSVSGKRGSPLLLIHSINAAASSAEVEPLRVHYGGGRSVYSLDLPGFGASERSDRSYTPRSLAFVSPTGFSGTRTLRQSPGKTRGHPVLYRVLRGPGWGAGLYRMLTRPGVIRYFLRRTWGSEDIDESLWLADVRESRHPGAQFAPLYFLSGELFSADIHTVYDLLRVPVWVAHGVRGDFVDYRQLQQFVDRNGWQVDTFDTGALPYFERREDFAQTYDQFLSQRVR